MLLEMVGQDELIRMATNQSYVMHIATYFEVPGQCFELFVFCWPRSWIKPVDCAEQYSDRMYQTDPSMWDKTQVRISADSYLFAIARLNLL